MHAYSVAQLYLFVTLRTVAPQAPLSMGFSKEEYWSGLPCPPPGDLPNPGVEPASPHCPRGTGEAPHPGLPDLRACALHCCVIQCLSYAPGRRPTGTPIRSPRLSSNTCRPQRMNRPDFLLLLLGDSVAWESHSSSQILNPLLCRVEDTVPPLSEWNGIICNILHRNFVWALAAGRRRACGERRQQQERENK